MAIGIGAVMMFLGGMVFLFDIFASVFTMVLNIVTNKPYIEPNIISEKSKKNRN